MTAAAMAACTPSAAGALGDAAAPSSGTSASIGMAATSWNRRIPNAARPWRAGELVLLAQHLQANAVDDSDRPRPATTAESGPAPSRERRGPDERGGGDDLQRAHAEHGAAHAPHPGRLQLQPDHEQEQHHAELGDVQGGVDLLDQVEPDGPITAPAAR